MGSLLLEVQIATVVLVPMRKQHCMTQGEIATVASYLGQPRNDIAAALGGG